MRENEDKEYRISGTLHHASIARRYAERVVEQGIWPAPTWYDASLPLEDELGRIGEGWPESVALAVKMYDAYPNHWWYGSVPEPWQPVAVEEQFWARVGDLVPDCPPEYADDVVTCGTDLVVREMVSGMLWIVDHKSKGFDSFNRSGRPRLEPWVRPRTGGGDHEQYKVHWQALVNLHLVRRAFPNEVVAGFIINRFSRKEPFLFDRHALHVSPRVYAEAPTMMLRAIQEEARIDGMVAAGQKPEPYLWNCYGRYGCCDYIDVCNADTEEQRRQVLSSKFHVVGSKQEEHEQMHGEQL